LTGIGKYDQVYTYTVTSCFD